MIMHLLKISVEGFLIDPVVEFLLLEPGEMNLGPMDLSFIEGHVPPCPVNQVDHSSPCFL